MCHAIRGNSRQTDPLSFVSRSVGNAAGRGLPGIDQTSVPVFPLIRLFPAPVLFAGAGLFVWDRKQRVALRLVFADQNVIGIEGVPSAIKRHDMARQRGAIGDAQCVMGERIGRAARAFLAL